MASIKSALGFQALPLRNDGIARLVCRIRLAVDEQHLAAGLCRYLRDAPAHGTGADDGDGLKLWIHAPDYSLKAPSCWSVAGWVWRCCRRSMLCENLLAMGDNVL